MFKGFESKQIENFIEIILFYQEDFQNQRLLKWRRCLTGLASLCDSALSLRRRCRRLRMMSTSSSGENTATRSSTSSTSCVRYVTVMCHVTTTSTPLFTAFQCFLTPRFIVYVFCFIYLSIFFVKPLYLMTWFRPPTQRLSPLAFQNNFLIMCIFSSG